MTYNASARTATRRKRLIVVVGLSVVFLAILAYFAYPSMAPSVSASKAHVDTLRRERSEPPADADGRIPDSEVVTVFDNKFSAVANLEPRLLAALRRAATDAAEDGIEFQVNSGWRSPDYQDALLQDAVSEYGSEGEAARWVATAETSPHVSGDAIDIGPVDATSWLSQHGAAYGLCQIYVNESWHYEFRPAAVYRGCPPTYADPTQDPRMQ